MDPSKQSTSKEETAEQTAEALRQSQQQRQRPSRYPVTHSCSTGYLRSGFRAAFFSRIRVNRSRSIDRLRQIVEGYGEELPCTSVSDLRITLLNDPEASALLTDTDVNDFLQVIDHEMAQMALDDQVLKHEQEAKKETEDIVDHHLHPCKICQQMCTDENEICAACQTNISNDMTNS
ncbi:unnamed protein product [Acanthoscelides obtectus]|uniref:Uncharacterized protein n=1 Tax=Acanthoscelides obtectus TaxID=200917 RepID=A0A9P0K101_ACAOB|nr:unnamed protein product [Acanthoscelides obtectus]CAK1629119.1 hypothetical protein AOBTE_LOCUS5591 [Acanthoscelides obtectus]